MFIPLSQQTEKMGERMNSAMNHRRGGVFQKMIMRDPVIMLTINGGILQNADIEMVPGSQLAIWNNGVINMAPGKKFNVPKGVEVYIGSGKIN